MAKSPVVQQQQTGQRPRELPVMELAIDKNGSPVTLEAGSWFVCFVPGLRKQW